MASKISHKKKKATTTYQLLLEGKEMENEARQNIQVNIPQISIYLANLGKVKEC